MERLGLYCRYLVTKVQVYLRGFEPDFVLDRVSLMNIVTSEEQEITAEFISAIAMENNELIEEWKRTENTFVVCTYHYKGVGPYCYYLDDRYNPTWPPNTELVTYGSLIPENTQILMASALNIQEGSEGETLDMEEEEEEEDFTDAFIQFAGPDGTFHGHWRFQEEGGDLHLEEEENWGDFNPKVIPNLTGKTVTLTFVNMDTKTINVI